MSAAQPGALETLRNIPAGVAHSAELVIFKLLEGYLKIIKWTNSLQHLNHMRSMKAAAASQSSKGVSDRCEVDKGVLMNYQSPGISWFSYTSILKALLDENYVFFSFLFLNLC